MCTLIYSFSSRLCVSTVSVAVCSHFFFGCLQFPYPLGVPHEARYLYCSSTEFFTCLHASNNSNSNSNNKGEGSKIPVFSVNDNKCDCEDGSDEPGTLACTNTNTDITNTNSTSSTVFWNGSNNNDTINTPYFYCFYTNARIPKVAINNGVCDCGDGSDEHETNILCFRAVLHHPSYRPIVDVLLSILLPVMVLVPCLWLLQKRTEVAENTKRR